MRNRTAILLTVALALPVTANLVSARTPNRSKVSPEVRALLKAKPFSDVGEFSGELAGTISLNGTSYRLASTASIYETARGLVPVGTSVSYRMVAVSGVILDGVKIVDQVIIRPASQAYLADDRITETPLGSGPR